MSINQIWLNPSKKQHHQCQNKSVMFLIDKGGLWYQMRYLYKSNIRLNSYFLIIHGHQYVTSLIWHVLKVLFQLWNCRYADWLGGESELQLRWFRICWVATPSINFDIVFQITHRPKSTKFCSKTKLSQEWLDLSDFPHFNQAAYTQGGGGRS